MRGLEGTGSRDGRFPPGFIIYNSSRHGTRSCLARPPTASWPWQAVSTLVLYSTLVLCVGWHMDTYGNTVLSHECRHLKLKAVSCLCITSDSELEYCSIFRLYKMLQHALLLVLHSGSTSHPSWGNFIGSNAKHISCPFLFRRCWMANSAVHGG